MSLHRQRPPEKGSKTTEIVSEIDRDKHILLQMLDLHWKKDNPADLVSMMSICGPCLEDQLPQNPPELSNAFLRRLWLHHPQARSSSCEETAGTYGVARPPGMDESSQSAVNPLDLVAAVYMTTNSFLQQEITYRMVQCNYAVPLYLPPVHPVKEGIVFLSPFRCVLGKWKLSASNVSDDVVKNMASSRMPLLSAVRLGRCNVSKSKVLNGVLGGSYEVNECFLNRDTDGGLLPRVLSDGLVEVTWNLSADENHSSFFPRPVLIANLRGDAADFEKQVSLLCYASAVLIVFCGHFCIKERKLLGSWRDYTSYLILVDCSAPEDEQNKTKTAKQLLVKDLELSEQSVIDARDGNEKRLVEKLRDALNTLVPHLHTTNLVAVAGMASDLKMTVDEGEACQTAFNKAEEVLNGVENDMSNYLFEQLPLQGSVWKRTCQQEQMEDKDTKDFAKQMSLMRREGKDGLVEELINYKPTAAMKTFIEALCTYDETTRAFFLSWMKTKLQVKQLDKLSNAKHEQQQEPCIGLEHFLREMGLVYERYFRGPDYDLCEMFCLPYLAAELLLYGVPLEIFDGDASVFPLNWVYSVLHELNRQFPRQSRLQVLTTLGFHNSKNAELLSALFGVNFPKWGQRQIKGAYMLLLNLPDNIRKEMDCEFLMLISTEGLNPTQPREEASLLRDTKLATFVSGLSDVTLVNLPHEAFDQSRANLQIAVKALLQHKDSLRKPIFQIVSEEQGKDAKVLRCIIDVLTQDESSSKAATDNQNCGLGGTCDNLAGPLTKPCIYAKTGRIDSDAALQLKQRLLAIFQKRANNNQPKGLGAFIEHMCRVWESIQNSAWGLADMQSVDVLVDLCTKLVEGQEQLSDLMDHWHRGLDERICDLKEPGLNNGYSGDEAEEILRTLKEEAATKTSSECEKINSDLREHLRQESRETALKDAYKESVLKRVHSIQQQVAFDMNPKIEAAMVRHNLSVKMKALLTSLEAALEVRLRSLLESNKNSDSPIEDKQLKEEFARVWNSIPSNCYEKPLDTHEICSSVEEQLRENLNSHGLKNLSISLQHGSDLSGFTVKNDHFALGGRKTRKLKHNKKVVQNFSNNLIEDCDKRISETVRQKEGYSDILMKDLLATIDKGLEVLKMEPFMMKTKFQVALKVYICSKALGSFQQMHNQSKKERETKESFLNENRERHLLEFVYNFHKRDQCQKAAQAFTALCLRPTAVNFTYSGLERQIFDDMLSRGYAHLLTSPKTFHYHLLEQLILKDSFENFSEYLQSKNDFCLKRIEDITVEHLSGSVMIEDQREQSLQQICQRMDSAIVEASLSSSRTRRDVKQFLEGVRSYIESPGDVTVPYDFQGTPLFDITSHQEHFVNHLKESVAELSLALVQEFGENESAIEVPEDLSLRLQKLLFDRVRGCDKQCPFCKAPCDLEGPDHAVHEAVVHRPKSLTSYSSAEGPTLSHISCFAGQPTYTDWKIPSETDVIGTYWKYVLVKYNTRFAQANQCGPVTLPKDWRDITQLEALRSLKEAFHVTV